MRKIREVLRLALGVGLELRKIERSLGISHATVAGYVARARAASLSWPLPVTLDDTALERLLFPPPPPAKDARPVPDWAYIHRELRRKGVTKMLLWEEYKRGCPDGYQLSRFYEMYAEWSGKLDLVMRQEHRAGEKLFVDFAGPTIPIVNRRTGEVLVEAQIFVAVLGASVNGTRKRDLCGNRKFPPCRWSVLGFLTGDDPGLELLLEPVALALDVDRDRVVEDTVQDRRGDDGVAEHLAPAAHSGDFGH